MNHHGTASIAAIGLAVVLMGMAFYLSAATLIRGRASKSRLNEAQLRADIFKKAIDHRPTYHHGGPVYVGEYDANSSHKRIHVLVDWKKSGGQWHAVRWREKNS